MWRVMWSQICLPDLFDSLNLPGFSDPWNWNTHLICFTSTKRTALEANCVQQQQQQEHTKKYNYFSAFVSKNIKSARKQLWIKLLWWSLHALELPVSLELTDSAKPQHTNSESVLGFLEVILLYWMEIVWTSWRWWSYEYRHWFKFTPLGNSLENYCRIEHVFGGFRLPASHVRTHQAVLDINKLLKQIKHGNLWNYTCCVGNTFWWVALSMKARMDFDNLSEVFL